MFVNKNIIIVIFLIVTIKISAQINEKDIDSIVELEMIRQNLPGLAIGVYKKGDIYYRKGYGYKDLDRAIPITTNTIFRWASISKTITAISALKLDELSNDSIFSIDDKVNLHYNLWASFYVTKDGKIRAVQDQSRKKKITIKNLLNNRSGINHYTRGIADTTGAYPDSWKEYESDDDNFNANSSVFIFTDAKLDFKPDSTYLYSSYGFNLIGAVIDKKYVDGYPKFVKTYIKDKLGLSSFKISNGDFTGFQKKTDGIINERTNGSKEFTLPAGGWESNIKDLLKYAKGIIDEKLLDTTSNLWSSDGYMDSDGNNQRYKRGINSAGSGNSLSIWHGGTHGNMKTLMYIIPNQDTAVVVMIPAGYAEPFNISNRILDKIGFGMSFKESPIDKCSGGMKSSDKKFIGIWRKTNDDVLIRRGYTTGNFNKEWKYLTSKGYHLENIEVDKNDKGKLIWEGIFKKGKGAYAMWRNFDLQGFHDKWEEMNSMGYRLYDIETYVLNNKRRWAGLFKKGTGKFALWRNFSTADFALKREQMAKLGLKLIDIEVYSSGGKLKWSGVWVPGTEGLLNRNYDYDAFKTLIRTNANKGFKLIDIETYMKNGKRKWAGIWEKSNQKRSSFSVRNYCKFMGVHDINSDKGYELLDLESY